MIRIDSVTKRYPDGTVAVDRLSLEIPDRSITVLVGPSGCGKTTTLRMINRMVEPTEGRILLDGEDVQRRPVTALRRGMGYVIQNAGLFQHRTIADNIATVPRMLGWGKQRARERAAELMERVGLDASLAKRYPYQLSGGQQQRVGVARALAADPPVLLMDEPFSAVDPVVRKGLQDELLRIQDELGKTIVFVTHDIDEAIKLGTMVAVLREGGRLAQYAPPAELLSDPADAFVEDFLGADRGIRRLSFFASDALELTTDAVGPGRRARRTPHRRRGAVSAGDRRRRPPARLEGTGEHRRHGATAAVRAAVPPRDGLAAGRAGLRGPLAHRLGGRRRRGRPGDRRGLPADHRRGDPLGPHRGRRALRPGARRGREGRRMNGFFDIPSDLQHSWAGLIGVHLREALLPVAAGLLLALPLALLCNRFRWLYPPVLGVTTVLYAVPSLAFFVVLIDWTGQTELTVMIPLALYSLVVLVPAIADGVRSVPDETLSAATAMGFGTVRRYLQVQLPIAAPAVIAGLRVATASSISLVSVGALIGNQGALGNLMAAAQKYDRPELAANAVLTTAVLAVVCDAALVALRRVLTPWMPRSGRKRTAAPREDLLTKGAAR
ncbi:ABC-type proline/glycine betaine transport system ATPase subunit/ABC-type proline/glycine betaine transport system permease subunit [Streptomyces albogriseolus]